MSKHKINFFESPNPQHFNFHNLNQSKYHHSEDPEINEDRLFTTPIRLNTSLRASPTPNIEAYLSYTHKKSKRRLQDDISEQYSQQKIQVGQQQVGYQEIKEKLVFSDNEEYEDLLVPITPLKLQLKIEEDEEATVKKKKKYNLASTILTPVIESRPVERGLKKLTAKAYKFVVKQKKTTYKQVAKKLLEQMWTERELTDNRAQLNTKRRVYDALNVLIALGLLRRNGNKLMIKREQLMFQIQEDTQRRYYARERQMKKDLELQQQLGNLQLAFTKKEGLLIQKRRMQEKIKQKFESFQELLNKNKVLQEKSMFLQKQKGAQISKILFPIFVISEQKTEQPSFLIKREIRSKRIQELQSLKQEQMKLWQDNAEVLSCSLSKGKQMQILGDLDVIAQWKHQYKKDQATKSHKKSRIN